MAFKSSVADTDAEPCALISVKNCPLISMGTQSSSGMIRDHRCLLRNFFLTSALVLSHYFHLLCLVSLYANHNSIKAHVPDWGQKTQHFEGLNPEMIKIKNTCDQDKKHGQLTPLIWV